MKRILQFSVILLAFLTSCEDTYIKDYLFDNDYFEKASDITYEINNWCYGWTILSPGTEGATPDKLAGSCWDLLEPSHNVWFKFVATPAATISITIARDNGFSDEVGTQQRTLLALWEKDGITELACSKYVNDKDDVSIVYNSLIPGEWYYLSVDVRFQEGGSFYLCIKDTI